VSSQGVGPVWAIVVAAGAGTRFGGTKQYAELAGRSVLSWSVAAAGEVCDGVVVVVPPSHEQAPDVLNAGADVVVAGGATRSGSVRAGLAAVPLRADVIVVHDAARPLASPALFAAVVAAVRAGADGATCAVAVTDTIKKVAGDRVAATIERSGLVAVQTPQAFIADRFRAAHQGAPEAGDDAAVVEAAGGKVVIVPGDPRNLKLTSPVDLIVASVLATR
jgi:2-C-methyl-D-erythritol 4-phosphate cytidylyltransferase